MKWGAQIPESHRCASRLSSFPHLNVDEWEPVNIGDSSKRTERKKEAVGKERKGNEGGRFPPKKKQNGKEQSIRYVNSGKWIVYTRRERDGDRRQTRDPGVMHSRGSNSGGLTHPRWGLKLDLATREQRQGAPAGQEATISAFLRGWPCCWDDSKARENPESPTAHLGRRGPANLIEAWIVGQKIYRCRRACVSRTLTSCTN